MADQFVGEIRIVGFNFAPQGWAFCNGQIMPISQNTALFSLLGTTFGGDGRSTFALPNMQGRVGVGFGHGPGLTDRLLGEAGGESTHLLTFNELPPHRHQLRTSKLAASTANPANIVFAKANQAGTPQFLYRPDQNNLASPYEIAYTGGNVAHENMQPTLAMNFIIALEGIFPPRS